MSCSLNDDQENETQLHYYVDEDSKTSYEKGKLISGGLDLVHGINNRTEVRNKSPTTMCEFHCIV